MIPSIVDRHENPTKSPRFPPADEMKLVKS